MRLSTGVYLDPQRAERAIKPSDVRAIKPSDVRAIEQSDVRAADLQEEMAEQRFSVPPDPTKTAATQRTSQRAERAFKQSASSSQEIKSRQRPHAAG